MQADDPPFLPVGTDVSAKYKGAFCEAKIKKVVRNIKCKVTFKGPGGGSVTVLDDAIKGTLRVGNTVEVKLEQKKEPLEAIITKIQDCSQYTVVFDDGDITTLRRSALCLKSGRHFAESETLDQLPLTHPEHFGNPVIGSTSRRGRRNNRAQSDDSDSEASEWAGGSGGPSTGTSSTVTEREPHAGRVVLVQCSTGDKKRAHHSHQWFPGLVVAPNAQDTVKIKVKDDYLVRSFKDGRYYTVPKKEAREFRKSNAMTEWVGVDAALLYLDKGVLPTHWDRDTLFGQESQSQSDEMDSEDSMDDEPHEEKDHFVAQLYKFMDDRGTPLNRQPVIGNKDVDLYRLFNVVQKFGGYNRVTNQNQWKRISVRLGFVPATPNITNLCRLAYKRFLHSFEDFYRKLGVTLLSHPKGGRTTGRSLIRDKDKMHSSSTQKSASPAPTSTASTESEKSDNKTATAKGKEKDVEKETKSKEKVKETDTKEKEIKPTVKDKDAKDKDSKEKEQKEKEKEIKEPKVVEKEKEVKSKEKPKDKDKESKEKTKEKENVKLKQRETKIKTENINSSEEDSGDNQPLAPLTIKTEKEDSPVEKTQEKIKIQDTPKSKLFKSASGTIDIKKSEKNSAKKIAHRRNSLPRCTPTGKSDNQTPAKGEGRCKSSSSDSSTNNKKQSDSDKIKDKDTSGTLTIGKKQAPSSDKNDSDSSSRGSKNGKTPRRNPASSNDITPPQTPASSNSQPQSNKKQRKRKITDTPTVTQLISADVGDKLKVYYGPDHSESKVTYEAKVIEITGKGPDSLLRVHYTGWNTRYDEWIKPSRIADNLSQHSKGKHKDKGKKNTLSEASGGKKPRSQSATTKPHTRNRSVSNNVTVNQSVADTSVQSDSDSDSESDSSGQIKKSIEDSKITSVDKINDTSSTSERENSKEKTRNQKITKTPNKRSAESSQRGVKRARTKQEDSPRAGRDFDLNEIRSELKGLDNAMKQPTKDGAKSEITTQTLKEDIKMTFKQEKTPEKVTEDIYEFKEPEPFEFEARKSEEKKKRTTTHRIFDDIPPLKLSPNSSPDKPVVVVEVEKVVPKTQYDAAFDKLCQLETYQEEDTSNNSGEKEGESLPIFSDGGEDSADRLMMSEADDSQEPLFTYQNPELFSEKFIPTFKNFTPAKNQETYSKKSTAIKLKTDIEDDFTNSPIKGEQSSDEDPIDAAIQRVNAHPMSDDSNDGDLLIKTPATPTVPCGGLLSTFATDSSIDVSKSSEKNTLDKGEVSAESRLEVLLKLKTDISNISGNKMETPAPKKEMKIEEQSTSKVTSLLEIDQGIDSKKEMDSASAFNDVIIPEPPAGFLIHKEGPSIAEKVLLKINSAKKASNLASFKETTKVLKPEPPKTLHIIPKSNLSLKAPEVLSESSVEMSEKQEKPNVPKVLDVSSVKEPPKMEVPKKEALTLSSVEIHKEPVIIKPDIVSMSKKETVERRKSSTEPTLGGKNNKVLSETIQKLSSQISQHVSGLPLPSEYQTDDRSESTDSDDSDSRLIIDKLSEEESQSCNSLPENSAPQLIKNQVEKAASSWTSQSPQIETEFSQQSDKPETSTANKESVAKQIEEDSNISLLLCEETIPGSPAPENLSEAIKINKPRPSRNLEPPFPHVSSMGLDSGQKEHIVPKEVIRDRENIRDNVREMREAAVLLRNERDCLGAGNSADTVLDNTPPITPDSSDGNDSPSRDQQLSDIENNIGMKLIEDESRIPVTSKISDIEKSSSGNTIRTSAPNSPGTGTRRGRRPRGCRLSDSEDQNTVSSYSHSNSHRQMKYNFYSEIDPLLDGAARIALITSRLSELRKVYHDLKAELATIDRRRKKLRRKEREAVKAAKAACS